MERFFPEWAIMCLAAVFLAASCANGQLGGDLPQQEGYCEAEFRIYGEGTRVTGISASDEAKVNHWALFVFETRDGALVASGAAASPAPIRKTLPTSDYRAYALVNYPLSGSDAVNPDTILTEDDLKGTVAQLADNSPASLEMFGAADITLRAGAETETIPVERLVAKVSLKKITVGLTNPALAAQTFTLRGIWMDNVYARTAFGFDYGASQLSDKCFQWYNAMDWHAAGSCQSPACPDELLGERGIDIIVPQGASHAVAHCFYVTPNVIPAVMDNRSGVWSKRCTRLVILASIGAKSCYYVISLPGLQRNHSYTIEEAIITQPGSEDPEQEVSGSLTLSFSSSDPDWEGPWIVSEAS